VKANKFFLKIIPICIRLYGEIRKPVIMTEGYGKKEITAGSQHFSYLTDGPTARWKSARVTRVGGGLTCF
jgi:hypothetical protein